MNYYRVHTMTRSDGNCIEMLTWEQFDQAVWNVAWNRAFATTECEDGTPEAEWLNRVEERADEILDRLFRETESFCGLVEEDGCYLHQTEDGIREEYFGEPEGKIVTFRVEFFYTDARHDNRETVDEWKVEEWRYPDLTAAEYMETSDWEMSSSESGIIVTLFKDDVAVSSVWWFKRDGKEWFNEIF